MGRVTETKQQKAAEQLKPAQATADDLKELTLPPHGPELESGVPPHTKAKSTEPSESAPQKREPESAYQPGNSPQQPQ